MRREPDHFGEEQELELVFIAKRLKEALRLEEVFTQAEIDYLVETDRYSGGIIFRSERVGAFFYVSLETARAARDVMTNAGFRPYDANR